MRSLWVHYPTDARARAIGDQYLWGRDLMIAPVYTKGATTKSVYLPSGDWYDWWTNARTTGGRTVQRDVDLATMPIYARAGAIVPVDPVRQHTGETISGPTTLRVFPGGNGDFTLYDDDGISQQYLNGRGNWIRMAWNDATNTLALEPGAPSGSTDVVRNRDFRVVLPDGRSKDVSYSGRRVTVVF
jgi:alpha-glucosidase/alpha-D-xyloside xylohydrolase